MSSAEAQVVFNQAPFQEPDEAQEAFSRQYDLSEPDRAMSTYQKVMHQHTKQQYDLASRRRTSASSSGLSSLSSESSNASSSS